MSQRRLLATALTVGLALPAFAQDRTAKNETLRLWDRIGFNGWLVADDTMRAVPGVDHPALNLDWTGEKAFETLAQIARDQGKSARAVACVVLSHAALGAGPE